MVAWLAFVVSIAALLWQAAAVVVDRPKLGVMIRNGVDVRIGQDPPVVVYTWHITVNNYGRRAQTIADVGLVGADASFTQAISTLRRNGHEVGGPLLPVTIEAHHFKDWIIPDDIMRGYFGKQQNRSVRAYVVRFALRSRFAPWNKAAELVRHNGVPNGFASHYQHGSRVLPPGP
jgi:hypothetical protein